MRRNNIPNILDALNWTPYRFWKELGGTDADRNLAYKLFKEPTIPAGTQWSTILKIAGTLGVKIDDLEYENGPGEAH